MIHRWDSDFPMHYGWLDSRSSPSKVPPDNRNIRDYDYPRGNGNRLITKPLSLFLLNILWYLFAWEEGKLDGGRLCTEQCHQMSHWDSWHFLIHNFMFRTVFEMVNFLMSFHIGKREGTEHVTNKAMRFGFFRFGCFRFDQNAFGFNWFG